MKTIKKIFWRIVLVIYICIVVFITACLLCYNDYNVTEFGDYTLLIIDNKNVDGYNKGDLVVVEKSRAKDIKENDDIFFYTVEDEDSVTVNLAKVSKTKHVSGNDYVYTVGDDLDIGSEYLVGVNEDVKVYKNMGTVLSILESRWAFLVLIILPVLLLFVYEIYEFVLEIKHSMKKK